MGSTPESWERMNVNMTHNKNTKTFSNIARHIELEDECPKVVGPSAHADITKSSFKMFSNFKFKCYKSKKGKKKGKKIVQGLKNKNKYKKF